jgi:hypothetical protein
MERAHPIVHLDTMISKRSQQTESAYWLSSRRLLIVTTEQEGEYGDPGWQGHLDICDLTSNSRTRLLGLTDLLNQRYSTSWSAPVGFEISPDGTCISWINHIAGGRLGYQQAVAYLDGSHFQTLETNGNETTFWLDDLHFASVWEQWIHGDCHVSEVRVYDVQNPTGNRKYEPTSNQAGNILNQYYQAVPNAISVGTGEDAAHLNIEVYRYQVCNPEDHPLHTYPVALPEHAAVLNDAVSPNHSMIACALRVEKPQPWEKWLRRLFPSLPSKPIITESLWICQTDGQGLQEIGHVPGKTAASGDADEQLTDLQWLPDGKQISFIYQNMLYTVPARIEK